MSDVEITEVREAHAFDEAALGAYLQEYVTDFSGPLTVKQFEGGQSCLLYTSPSPRDS